MRPPASSAVRAMSVLYAKVLRRFAATYSAGMPELERALAERSMAGLAAAMHSLGSACGAIGATVLRQEALGLEKASRESESELRWERARALQARLGETAARIASAFAAS